MASPPLLTTPLCLLAFVVIADALRSGHKEANNGDSSSKNDGGATPAAVGGGVVTLPLLPRRAVVERSMRERRGRLLLDFGGDATFDDYDDVDAFLAEYDDAHDNVASRRRRRGLQLGAEDGQQRTTTTQLGALYQGYGTHYVDLWVGSPMPQRQTVIVDTGSSATAFPCSACHDCGASKYHTDDVFHENESESYALHECHHGRSECTLDDSSCASGASSFHEGTNVCTISMSYAEGSSWHAVEGTDVAYAGGPHDVPLLLELTEEGQEAEEIEEVLEEKEQREDTTNKDAVNSLGATQFRFPLTFGCQYKLTGLFKTQLADGIMGMDNESSSFWRQMHDANKINRKAFAMCFVRSSNADVGAGALTLGGYDPRLHEIPMVFANSPNYDGWYGIRVVALYLRAADGSVGIVPTSSATETVRVDVSENQLNEGEYIVDSGTTDTYLPKILAKPFNEAWKQVTGFDYTNDAVRMTDDEFASLPTVLVRFAAGSSSSPSGRSDEGVNAPSTLGLASAHPHLPPPSDDDGGGNPDDVLIALSPAHYMTYHSEKNEYVARLYFRERSGGTFGANTMMGHNVYFDVEGGVVGWAESKCDYDRVVADEEAGEGSGGSGVEDDGRS